MLLCERERKRVQEGGGEGRVLKGKRGYRTRGDIGEMEQVRQII